MNVALPYTGSDSSGFPGPLGWVIIYHLILFGFLYRILTRADLDTMNKILWVIVVVFVPILGMVLYLVTAPAPPPAVRPPRPGYPVRDTQGTPWEANPDHTKDS